MSQVKYKNFILDPFQVKAIESIENNHSVVVSAATGTGKTLIADYAINKWKNLDKRIIYTAPIKALSNQKYRDFKKEYGEDKVGIMTGDVVINPDAHLIIMTTEIYRNMLMTKDSIVDSIAYVVFDEIHYMSDKERGTIWEESLIFSPENIRFLCLSATIPNAKEFAEWIQNIKKHKVDIVSYDKRAVPLEHFLYDVDHGVINSKDAYELQKSNQMPDYYKLMRRRRQRKKSNEKPKIPKHYELVTILKHEKKLPCIFFAFSRRGCEEKAQELAMKNDFLTGEQKQKVLQIFNKKVKEEYRYLESVRLLKSTLQKGIGIHHAGILPALKEVVEELFAEGIIKVLYATETFAVGINMPAKSVCFSSLVKYDGIGFNLLRSKEYFQMAGRAGRRGIDDRGYVISILERRNELDKILKLISSDSEPIISQFRLEPNTVLNMINNHNENEIDVILKSNFDYFLRKRDDIEIRIKARFNNLVKRLKKYKYINEDNTLTDKGIFATKIYSNELLVTELFSGKIYKNLSETELCILIAAIVYEYRRSDSFFFDKKNKNYQYLAQKVVQNRIIEKDLNIKAIRDLWKSVSTWANGSDFEDLSELSEYQEGDYIRLFRQMVDCMNQIRKATEDRELEQKIVNCMNRIYRDVVKFEF
ncbi:MAG: DEAD/DEAH box helicase [Candidatus Woesearchaeota archaeon]